MAWKEESGATFSGGSGQMAVISELLHRKCNAAIPHVDIGMDVFAFRDDQEEVARIQVKTASGKLYKKRNGFSAKFNVPTKQLSRTDNPRLFYAFVVRLGNAWGCFVVISRAKLYELWNEGLGSENKESLGLYMRFRPKKDKRANAERAIEQACLSAHCGNFDMTDYVNAWESLPPLKPPVAIDKDEAGTDHATGEMGQKSSQT